MRSLKHSDSTPVPAAERPLVHPFYRATTFHLRALMVALLVVLAGCTSPHRAPERTSPVQIPESTWWQVDSEVSAAAVAAIEPAENFARGSMESWGQRVRQRTEADFIPWFTGYWTQQWLAIRVAWYKLGSGDGTDPAVRKLAAYLQEQYRDRVLGPVGKEIDPDLVRGQVTRLYVQLLGEQLRGIPQRHGVPLDQYDRRLKDIPAIALAPPTAHNASLYQLVHADPLTTLPAYVALITRIRKAAGGEAAGPSDARISPVAQRASEKLVARLAASGGASAAAAAIGGIPGMVISLGAAGIGAIAHAKEQPAMEAQLRENLNAALDEMWQTLMEDPDTGVLAGVYYLSEQIQASLARTPAQPVELERLPQEAPLEDEQTAAAEADAGVADEGDADE